MNTYYKRKPCRSDSMRAEEIQQERERSGWNPYVGEEEDEALMSQQPPMMPPQPAPDQIGQMMPPRPMPGWSEQMLPPRPIPIQPGQMMPSRPVPGRPEQMLFSGPMPGQPEAMQPFFLRPEYAQVLEDQKQIERDLRTLQSMYPQAARTLLPYIEEECDKMEYEGSSMYAQYPDQTTIYNIQDRIYNQVKDQFDVQEEAPDEMLSMQFDRNRRDPRGKNWLDNLIRVLLLQEMHHRRRRHRDMRRRY